MKDKSCIFNPFVDHGFLRSDSHSENRYVCSCEHTNYPSVYWFELCNSDSLVELENFIGSDIQYVVDDDIVCVSINISGKQRIISEDKWIGIPETKDRILVGEIVWC